MSDADDTVLLQRAMQHDRGAFAALVLRHQGRVRGFLRRLCRDHALADDLAQECFLLAWRKLPELRTHSSLGAWLCSIAYRCFLQALRTREREAALNALYTQPCQNEAETAEAGTELQARDLEQAMALLNPQEVAAITLHFSLGHSHSEIAEILDLPLGTVKSLLARALPKLRVHLTTDSGVRHHDER